MRLKLFKKYFFTTFIIIALCMAAMIMILSVVLNSYLVKSKQNVLKKACYEVCDYIAVAADDGGKIGKTELLQFFDSVGEISDADVFAADIDGNIILCSCDSDGEAESCIHSGVKLKSEHIGEWYNARPFKLDTLDIYEETRFVTAEPLLDKSGERYGTVFAVTPVLVVNDLLSTVIKIFLAAAVVPLIIMFIAIYIMTYRLTKPLKLMSQASRAMAKGDFSKRIPVMSDDEIGELAVSFNMMTNSLAQLEGMRKSFVANVSHELKTPMTTIGGFIDGILDGTIEPERQSYYLGIVSDEVKRLSRLVQSMLSMARLESGEFPLKPELFDLSALLCSIVISQEQRIEQKKLNIIGLDGLENISVNADRDLLHQAIYNLVDNAIKFSEEGGNISFELKTENKKTVLTVINTGKGIPEKELPFVFERFYKVDKSRSASKNSTGLGLYIVKTIITAHGGTVAVSSKENEFTAFKVTLP
ncbi:MAG: HAMP domain-containing sensor histidine kinase [Acutalibacteraceae bacterium]|nr:HAMP domain-containing sensor histidine kinase [Acutalibacteraceae bacterium]